jgi:LacI family transcriptional regulator
LSKPTIKDIAKALNINVSTVSRALKNHPDISAKLKEKIKLFADSLGYTPNEFAVGLRRGKSMTIGLIIPEISMYFFPSIIQAVEEMTHEKNYHLMVLHSNDSLEREMKNAHICSTAGVDGLLVSLSKETNTLQHFGNLSSNHVPIVYFDKVLKKESKYNVEIRGERAAYDAVNYLFSNNERPQKILGIFGDKRLSITQDRLEGFTNALKEQGKEITNENLLFADNPETTAKLFENIYTSKDRPDALFIMSDELLAGVCEVIRCHHIKIPKDLKMIAMSDGLIPRLLGFDLPYVHTSGYKLGKFAASLLFDLIEKKEIDPETFYIDTPLINASLPLKQT